MPIAAIDIKSSTTANDNKNILREGFNLFLNNKNKPTAKAISVDIGIQIPFKKGVFLLNIKNIIAGITTPPKDAITGKDAFLKLDRFPYSISCLISSPATKKNIAIKKSFINICKEKLGVMYILLKIYL